MTSTVTTGAYVINCVAPPTFSPVAGTYTGTQSVTISSAPPVEFLSVTQLMARHLHQLLGTVYSGAVSVPVNLTLNAIAYETGMGNSTVTSGGYTIQGGPSWSLVGDFSTSSNPNTVNGATWEFRLELGRRQFHGRRFT